MKTFLKLLTLLIVVNGCSTRTLTLPDGRVIYKSVRFGMKEAIKRVEYKDANGQSFVLEGYASDQVEALGVVTEAAVRGAVSGVKP